MRNQSVKAEIRDLGNLLVPKLELLPYPPPLVCYNFVLPIIVLDIVHHGSSTTAGHCRTHPDPLQFSSGR